MNAIPDKIILDDAASEYGIEVAFIEKDWYVTQIISIISEFAYEDVQMVFTGGTALSKAHKLLKRFSEDIDFRVIYPSLAQKNGSQQRTSLSKLKHAVFAAINNRFSINQDKIIARNSNRFFAFEHDFPSLYDRAAALRPHVLIEFTVTSMSIPPLLRPVSSLINELAGKAPEVSSIACIDPVENAVDKLSAFVWRTADRVRNSKDDDPTIVRHQHDLAILKEVAINHPDFKRLSKEVIAQDDGRSKKIAGFTIEQKFKYVIELIKNDKEYKNEYDVFVRGMSYATKGDILSYDDSLKNVKLLMEHVLQNDQ